MMPQTNEILFKKFEIIACYKKDEHSAVYLAKHIYLDKKVFLKVLNTEIIRDSSINERFKREAKILAQLEHPNIIKVYDFGMFKEHFYISFEYFENQNLREVLATKRLSEVEKNEIFIQLVKGLNFAHNKNVIHRDIKPENILVNINNEVKLTDFGLAQDSFDNLVTQKYSVVGTPAYMSPEQIQGDKLTIQSDLFSLGITALELFSGKNYFLGKDSSETLNNIISFDEKNNNISYLNLPNNIQQVLKGLLVANTENRFHSCEEVLAIFNIETEKKQFINNKRSKNAWLYLFLVLFFFIGFWLVWTISQLNEINDFDTKSALNKTDKNIDTVYLINEISNKSDLVQKSQKAESNRDESANSKLNDERKIIEKPITAVNLNMDQGELYIKCYPWAKVYLDNKFIETTPLTKNINAKPGTYLLTLVHPDYPKFSDTIHIKAKELSFVEVNLDTLFGFFDCQVYPWSEIYINGEKKGVTPLDFPLRLNEGSYKLTLRNPKFKDLESIISIKKNDTLRLKFKMVDSIIN